ncbi:MAG: hypothetical protein LBU73_01215 [Helicobacteraceae bacterium]|jgi:hypothetical protein|nr:hypothetical protein [Helicobacteraceae bacterium]
MKKLLVLFFSILLTTATRLSAEDGGTFTLTGIPSEYNGKYALILANIPRNVLRGHEDAKSENTPISNGRVTFPLWIANTGNRYSGNDAATNLIVAIYLSEKTKWGEIELDSVTFPSVPFTNGSATKTWKDGQGQKNKGQDAKNTEPEQNKAQETKKVEPEKKKESNSKKLKNFFKKI